MKRISFFLALALIIASFGLASANSVSLDNVTGEWEAGKIAPGAAITLTFQIENTHSTKIGGMVNGFVVTTDAGSFTTPVGAVDAGFEANWDLGFFINYFGPNSDTVGFGGAIITGTGIPVGYVGAPISITTGGIDSGATICIDSAYYPPSGTWKWAAGATNIFPEWDGPHCYQAVTPDCLPPDFSGAPLSMSGSHCSEMTIDFDAALNPAHVGAQELSYSASFGGIDANGVWTYNPTFADVGAVTLTVSASNGSCQTDIDVNLTFTNEAPVIACPEPVSITAFTPFNMSMTAFDECNDVYTWSTTSTIASIDPNTGVLTITADEGSFSIEVTVDDGDASSTCTVEGNASNFIVEIGCVGDEQVIGDFVYQGQHVNVPVTLTTGREIGGYDFLIGYDNSALSFQGATIGEGYDGEEITHVGTWEYFSYRYGPDGNCSNACPSGMLRVVAIAETNNGANHPEYFGAGELFNIDFLVTNDRTMECQMIPLSFYWMDCGDNAFSSKAGDELWIAGDVVGPAGSIFSNSALFPTYQGPNASCEVAEAGKLNPQRLITFKNGCVQIACADLIDARGDLNLNNVAYEIADAVLYSNYFVFGLNAFSTVPNTMQGQIAASDVNADGLSLSVADLVYLIRVIIGDANAYDKLAPVNASFINDNGTLTVDSDMGAVFVIVEGNATPTLLADNMTMEYNFDGANTRVLVYSMEANSFSGEFLNVNGNVISTEFASVDGATVNAKLIPANFELAQNYPNPFNPSTTVGFSIPFKSDVTLTVYNVTGQKVVDFAGSYEAGIHSIEWDASAMASGIYFYKINAGNFSDTKKMVLLK